MTQKSKQILLVLACFVVCFSGILGPVFEEQPMNTLYPEESGEEKLTLGCRVRASPPATYRWKVNGTEIDLEGNGRYSLVGGNLVIKHPVRSRDPGSYQCLATNPIGTVISKEAFLRFGYLSQFPTEERDAMRVTEGMGVVLPCNPPPHYPGSSYRWFFNDIPNFLTPSNRLFISQVTGNLYIARTWVNDTGGHSCYLTSQIDYATTSVFSKPIPLAVQPVGDARQYSPNIKVKFPSEIYVLSGQMVNLECFALGNPEPTLQWRRLDGTMPFKASGTLTEPVLHLPDVQFEDEGTYECLAENSRGKDSVQGRIIVHAQPEWLRIISDEEADIGSDLEWSCAAAGKPRPACRWLRNGLPLTSKVPLEINNCALKILRLVLIDSGIYQCVAGNKHGTIYANAELKVQAFAPEFQSNPVRRLIPAARGGEVMIECRPRSAPKPTVFWSKGGEGVPSRPPIPELCSHRVSIALDGTLRVRNVSRSDEGRYTCFTENFLGKANSTGTVSIREATKITLAPANADVNLNENITLQCHASHDPTMDLTFTWSVDGSPIDFDRMGQHYRRAVAREAIGDLTITHAELRHAGTYMCTAQTVVDSTSAHATLVVRGPPGPAGGVVVKKVNDSSVLLSWSRGSDNHSPIGSYNIQARALLSQEWRNVRTGGCWDLFPTGKGCDTNAILYLYCTSTPERLSHTVRPVNTPTVAPSSIAGGGGDRHEVAVTWTPVQREYQNGPGFGYVISLRRQGTEQWVTARVAGAESTQYVYRNDTIGPYTPFEVKVKPFNSEGQGPFSQVAIVHSAEEEPSVVPSRVSATSLSSTEMKLSWEAVEQVTRNGILLGYEIRYWRENDNEAAADRVRTLGLETTARVSGLRPHTLYHVEVRAYNSAGTGPPGPSTVITTKKAPPSQPPGKVSWKSIGSWIRIKWDHVKALENESAVAGYKVRLVSVRLVETSKNSVQLPMAEDMSYLVEIRASGEGGDGTPTKVRISKHSELATVYLVNSTSLLLNHLLVVHPQVPA
uniref:Contactin-2 n=1 Tax=Callorhinchus milii TaxID=7868 RepID=A0A4W3JB79_CALMI